MTCLDTQQNVTDSRLTLNIHSKCKKNTLHAWSATTVFLIFFFFFEGGFDWGNISVSLHTYRCTSSEWHKRNSLIFGHGFSVYTNKTRVHVINNLSWSALNLDLNTILKCLHTQVIITIIIRTCIAQFQPNDHCAVNLLLVNHHNQMASLRVLL